MNANRLLKPREEELMEFLWAKGEPLTIADMEERLDKNEWNHVTLYRIVRGLIENGYLQVCGVERGRTQYYRKLETTLTREEYAALWLQQKDIHVSDLGDIVAAMLGGSHDQEDNEELIKELEQIIDRLRNGDKKDA